MPCLPEDPGRSKRGKKNTKKTMSSSETDHIRDSVKNYYGKTLKSSKDLKTQACVAVGRSVSKSVKEAAAAIHEEVASKYYGCGLIIPPKLDGMKVLDLGSGSGRDCFILSKLVGPNGHVTGVDMTDEQLAVARKYVDYHTEKFGYERPNIEFVKGYLENLTEAGIKENHYDVLVSNCTINLVPNKEAVLYEASRALKIGGELYFSDIYTDTFLPEEVRKNEILWGEGFSGALHWKDLFKLAEETGFSKPYMVTASPVNVEREDFKKILGNARYASITYRLFNVSFNKESATQVTYKGKITGYEEEIQYDHSLTFKAEVPVCVSGNVATIIRLSRFAGEFKIPPAPMPCGKCNNCNSKDIEEGEDDPFVYLDKKKRCG